MHAKDAREMGTNEQETGHPQMSMELKPKLHRTANPWEARSGESDHALGNPKRGK